MAVVTVQVGQAGNQLGSEFLNVIHGDENGKKVYFRRCDGERDKARAVLVDMEPKVVESCMRSRKRQRWKYDTCNTVCGEGGSGNNWASGYMKHGPRAAANVIELVRKEIETTEAFGGFAIFHSVAGGTGSGLGSFITEALRDTHGRKNIFNMVVWPHSSGEVVVQSYNSVLTLSHVLEDSDAVICLNNDDYSSICKRMLHIKKPDIHDLNRAMAKDLANVLLPAHVCGSKWQKRNVLNSICSHVCSHPSFKLLQTKSVPQMPLEMVKYSSHGWRSILKHLHQMHRTTSILDETMDWSTTSIPRSVANSITLRGSNVKDAVDIISGRGPMSLSSSDALPLKLPGFTDPLNYSSWFGRQVEEDMLQVRYVNTDKGVLGGYEKVAALLNNGNAICAPLSIVSSRAQEMFQGGAYIHQYENYKLEKDDFIDAFVKTEQVLANYRSL